jgi:uncharacterized protein (TIGR00251 family)
MDITQSVNGVVFKVKAMPNAGKNALAGEYNGMLKIKISAQPERGKANEELADYLSGLLKISKSRIEIIKGAAAREKTISIKGLKIRDILKLTEAQNG